MGYAFYSDKDSSEVRYSLEKEDVQYVLDSSELVGNISDEETVFYYEGHSLYVSAVKQQDIMMAEMP